jgi:hypothetical protein
MPEPVISDDEPISEEEDEAGIPTSSCVAALDDILVAPPTSADPTVLDGPQSERGVMDVKKMHGEVGALLMDAMMLGA